ncbi:MAG: insulinase family protein [Nanoarchaeota archaeon]|nr:insulinase family protein [Nanoarchaeota archaeon]
MKKYSLSNGLTIIEEKKPSDSVTVQVTVRVGSNYERDGIRGISHFIEHMLFEGTKNRKDAGEISNEIESLGGEINAYTDNIRTCFYIKVPKKHFKKAVDIISDIIKNPLFRNEDIEKEREVILKEINIFNDESRFYQWILFQKTLFSTHPSRYPAYGTKREVRRITREDIVGYFDNYYTASNSIVSIIGDIKDSKKIILKYFSDFRKGKKIRPKDNPDEPASKKIKISKIIRKIMNSYFVLGYKTVSRTHDDSYVLDVIQAILGRGQSGKMFDEIRNKRGLAYEVGVHHEASTDFGFFAAYLSTDKKNISLIKTLIVKVFSDLSKLKEKELKDAIGFVEGRYILDSEDTHNNADSLGFWELIKDANLEKSYLRRIKKVSRKDISRVAKKYLGDNYTLAVIEQR